MAAPAIPASRAQHAPRLTGGEVPPDVLSALQAELAAEAAREDRPPVWRHPRWVATIGGVAVLVALLATLTAIGLIFGR